MDDLAGGHGHDQYGPWAGESAWKSPFTGKGRQNS
ncbi:hypothetical protein YSA_04103 [Pseudomonas putida ND6]|uniref:Uncharacterized protein n=1 Tax=Pseudomonas putida ND6 TaxID=231023 RepID=I3UU19_PSEPU|nr:hypothetical protein YSA_04103 [Pseudomonas putida ND6]